MNLPDEPAECLICSMEDAEDDRVVFRDELWAAEVAPAAALVPAVRRVYDQTARGAFGVLVGTSGSSRAGR